MVSGDSSGLLKFTDCVAGRDWMEGVWFLQSWRRLSTILLLVGSLWSHPLFPQGCTGWRLFGRAKEDSAIDYLEINLLNARIKAGCQFKASSVTIMFSLGVIYEALCVMIMLVHNILVAISIAKLSSKVYPIGGIEVSERQCSLIGGCCFRALGRNSFLCKRYFSPVCKTNCPHRAPGQRVLELSSLMWVSKSSGRLGQKERAGGLVQLLFEMSWLSLFAAVYMLSTMCLLRLIAWRARGQAEGFAQGWMWASFDA